MRIHLDAAVDVFDFPFQPFPEDAYASVTGCDQLPESNCVADPRCKVGCSGAGPGGGCVFACVQRPCNDVPREWCPSGLCILAVRCDGLAVCDGYVSGSTGCTPMGGYAREPCCPGLHARCGMPTTEGTCDMTTSISFGYPLCLACGDGKCDPPENECNCPEDC